MGWKIEFFNSIVIKTTQFMFLSFYISIVLSLLFYLSIFLSFYHSIPSIDTFYWYIDTLIHWYIDTLIHIQTHANTQYKQLQFHLLLSKFFLESLSLTSFLVHTKRASKPSHFITHIIVIPKKKKDYKMSQQEQGDNISIRKKNTEYKEQVFS